MTVNSHNESPDNQPLQDIIHPKKATLTVWWAIAWRFAAMLIILLLCVLFLMVFLHGAHSVSVDITLLVGTTLTIVGSLILSYYAVRTVLGKPLNDSILIALPLHVYRSLLPGNIAHLVCRLEKSTEPYRMTMKFTGEAAYRAVQLNSERQLYTITDNQGLEVAHCSQASLLGETADRFIIARSDKDEPSIEFQRPSLPNSLALHIGETVEILKYRRAKQKVEVLGATLHFKWNRIDVMFDRNVNKLSDPLLAAAVFFIFLERSKAGGW